MSLSFSRRTELSTSWVCSSLIRTLELPTVVIWAARKKGPLGLTSTFLLLMHPRERLAKRIGVEKHAITERAGGGALHRSWKSWACKTVAAAVAAGVR